jgi:hypothetical protein
MQEARATQAIPASPTQAIVNGKGNDLDYPEKYLITPSIIHG